MNRTRRNLIGISFHQAAPTAVRQLTTKDKHCHFIGRARQGEPFYIPAENISCPLARFHLGIENIDLESLARTLVSWTDAVDQNTGLKFLRSAHRMNQPYKYIAYFTYPENGLKPDVIIRICNSEELQPGLWGCDKPAMVPSCCLSDVLLPFRLLLYYRPILEIRII